MKAIFVIDINDELIKEWNVNLDECFADIRVYSPTKNHKCNTIYGYNRERFKELPQKIERIYTSKTEQANTDNIIGQLLHNTYAKGYNKAIDEILGEE